jgi:hypothetical protein
MPEIWVKVELCMSKVAEKFDVLLGYKSPGAASVGSHTILQVFSGIPSKQRRQRNRRSYRDGLSRRRLRLRLCLAIIVESVPGSMRKRMRERDSPEGAGWI